MKPGIDFVGVSVSFFCHDGKDFLIHKRSDKCRDEIGRWDFGGGQLEFGETPHEAVLREVKEEYQTEGAVEKQLPSYSLIRKENGVESHWLIMPFIIKLDRKKVRIDDPEKIS